MERFVMYAVGDAFLIDLRNLLVNGETKETMETFGLGIGSRDISGGGVSSSAGGSIMSGDESDRLVCTFPWPFRTPPLVPCGHA